MNRSLLLAVLIVPLWTAGCGPVGPQFRANDERTEFIFPVRQLPPEPVYNRLRYVLLPDVKPAVLESGAGAGGSRVPLILPVFHFTMKSAPLKEIAQVLAATARYTSSCSSSVADHKMSIDALGNLEELSQQIAEKANVTVIVDHSAREVRFVSGGVSPELLQ